MQRARVMEAFVDWALSIVLAGIFLLAGVPKLFGIDTVGLQAAAMHGFPDWVRVVAGLVEVVGAVALLVPATATMAALLLAAAMVPATLTQYQSGEGGIWVPLLVLAALLFVAWRRNSTVVRDRYRGFAAAPHPLLYDGVLAGFLGAAVIAVWFFVIDSIAGHPLFTPATLGRGLLGVVSPEQAVEGTVTPVLVYTVFHFAAFMLVGLAASLVVVLARREASVLFAFLLLFAVTEVGIYALVGILDVATPLGSHAWLQLMAGNLLATVVMGLFFWRRNRELGAQFRRSLDWEAPAAGANAAEPLMPPGATRA